MGKIRVLLADDHSLFREGLVNILNSQPDFEVVGEAGDGLEAIIMARKITPDLILMDVTMPGCDGLEATLQIKKEQPRVTIVMLTVRDEDENLFQAIRNGAQGYLLKSISSRDMIDMSRRAMRGEPAITPSLGGRMLEEFRRMSRLVSDGLDEVSRNAETLTAREQQILGLVAGGATNQEIAGNLSVSIHTVKSHLRKIMAKLHQAKRREAAYYALREGLIPPTQEPPIE